MSETVSRRTHAIDLIAVFGYAALLGVVTAGTLSTVQVLRTTPDPVLAFVFSAYALLIAVPLGLAAAFMALGIALALRRLSLGMTHSRTVASIGGGIGVVAVGIAVTALLTHELFHDLRPVGWLAYAGCLVGGAAFVLWSLRCAAPA